MRLPFWEHPRPAGAILGPALEDIMGELCDQKQLALLTTPYLHFESRFLERNGQELRIRAAMNRDAAKHTLGQHPLRLRFPWALAFYSGPTRVLAYEQEEHRRSLRITMPDHVILEEQRRAFRVERVGRSTGAVGTEDGLILRVSLENLSMLGAGVFCLEPVPAEKFQTGRVLDLSLSLDQGYVLMAAARICNTSGQSLGLAFHPPLAGRELQRLSEWLAPREEEARRRWENRAELRAKAEQAARPKAPPSGVLLLTSNSALRDQVTASLEDIQPLRTVTSALAPFKEALAQPPLLLLLDGGGLDMEARYRYRTILEAAPVDAPMVILGDGQDPEGSRLLAAELKATTYLDWNPEQGIFFRRLVQGLIQQHWKTSLGLILT